MFSQSNMTFQYFFFDTYMGYFLQMIPIALIAYVVSVIYKKRKTSDRCGISPFLAALFPAYIAALLGLTLFSEKIRDAYYVLFYHQSPWPLGEGGYRWFTFVYNFDISFLQYFGTENLGNILLFLPFGILYPLSRRESSWKKTLLFGIGTSLIIENIQPFMDRSFDINDVILNTVGVGISTILFFSVRWLWRRKNQNPT